MAKRRKVLVQWLKPSVLLRDGRGYPRQPGDQDVVEYDQIKGSIGAEQCLLLGPVAQVPQVVNVHTVDTLHTDED